MERTEYFNYTRPTQTQLNNTEDSKIRSILRRMRSGSQMGIRTGFRVTVNAANATTIDIGPGEGYTGGYYQTTNLRGSGSGERISTLSEAVTGDPGYNPTATGVALASYTTNTENYVSLVYAETTAIPLAERYYPFTSHETIVSETFSVSVLTAAQWAALTTAQLENRFLVAIVTAGGAGVALTASSIQQVVQPRNHPTPVAATVNMGGITLSRVSQDTIIGSGTLRFAVATSTLFWTAPGDVEGAGVIIPSSGTYTLYSNNVSYTLSVIVVAGNLPAVDTSITVNIEALYGREIPMFSGIDQAHRDMLGTGTPTINNPHATSIDDLTGGTFDHADLYHVNGISKDADSDNLGCSIDLVNDQILINNPGGFANSFLIDGLTYKTLTGIAAGTNGTVSFDVVPSPDSGDYLIYIDSAGNAQSVRLASYAPGGAADLDVLWSGNIQIVDMHNNVNGNGTITWNSVNNTLTWQAPGDAAAGALVYVVDNPNLGFANPYGYYKLYSQDPTNWVIVFLNGAAIGASNASTFAVTKDETDYPDESMLKLAIVTWNDIGELLGNLRDIRRFVTADNREETEEEHDSEGQHVKTLRNALRIHVASEAAVNARAPDTAFYGRASDSYAYYGLASSYCGYFYATDDYGVWGSAADAYGVYGRAESYGVFGSATVDHGVYGSAPTIGVYGRANNTGVGGQAIVNVGVRGIAGADYGVVGSAADEYGVYGLANQFGVYGLATSNDAFFNVTGVYGGAANNAGGGAFGVWGAAADPTGVGVYGKGGSIGGYFSGVNTGMYATAPTIHAISADAPNSAIHGEAVNDYGVVGSAGDATGVYGRAVVNIGVYGTAADYGVYGIAADTIGVFGTADDYGVYGQAESNHLFLAVTGVFGSGSNNLAGGAFGVYGSAGDANGRGVYGKGGSIGGAFSGANTGLHITSVIRYDVTEVNAGLSYTNVPIILDNGNTYCLMVYQTA